MQKQCNLNRVVEKSKSFLPFSSFFGQIVVIVGLVNAFRLERSGCNKRKNIKNFLNGQSLLDVHRQYLQTFPIDLQAEVSRFRCLAYFLKN